MISNETEVEDAESHVTDELRLLALLARIESEPLALALYDEAIAHCRACGWGSANATSWQQADGEFSDSFLGLSEDTEEASLHEDTNEIEDIYDEARGLTESQSTAADTWTSSERIARIQWGLRESSTLVDLRLYRSVAPTLASARRLAELELEARRSSDDVQRKSWTIQADAFRLLSQIEALEGSHVVPLHTPETSPWTAFLVCDGRLRFGAFIDGQPYTDTLLEDEAPDVHERLMAMDSPTLKDISEAFEVHTPLQNQMAMRRQMARALCRAVEPGADRLRVKIVAVNRPEKFVSFSALDVLDDIRALHVCVERESLASEFFQAANAFCDVTACFRVIDPDAPPLLMMRDGRLHKFRSLIDITSLAQTVRGAFDELPNRPKFALYRMEGSLWGVFSHESHIVICRAPSGDFGRIVGLAQRLSMNETDASLRWGSAVMPPPASTPSNEVRAW